MLAWIVTGPIGRVVAFVADLAAYSWKGARKRLVGHRGSDA
jgi:hypothetical protein